MRKARHSQLAAVPFGVAQVPTSLAAASVTEEPRGRHSVGNSSAGAARLRPWAPEDHSPDAFRLQYQGPLPPSTRRNSR